MLTPTVAFRARRRRALSTSTVRNTTTPTITGSSQPLSGTAVVANATCMNGRYPKASCSPIISATHSHEMPFVVNSSRRMLDAVVNRLANR